MSKWSSAYRDSRWQRLRLKIMERDNWTCQSCGCTGEGILLNVHHIYYEKNKAPWEYEDDVLITLCEKCHEFIHADQKRALVALSKYKTHEIDSAIYALENARNSVVSVGNIIIDSYADDDELHRKLLELQNVFYNMLSANVVEEKQ